MTGDELLEAIADIPRELLQALGVVPLRQRNSFVVVICTWDARNEVRMRATESALSAYFPDQVRFQFVQNLDRDPNGWMLNILDMAYGQCAELLELPSDEASALCAVCCRSAEDVRLFSGRITAVCEECAQKLRKLKLMEPRECQLCDSGAKAKAVVQSDDCVVCLSCLDLIDSIVGQ